MEILYSWMSKENIGNSAWFPIITQMLVTTAMYLGDHFIGNSGPQPSKAVTL